MTDSGMHDLVAAGQRHHMLVVVAHIGGQFAQWQPVISRFVMLYEPARPCHPACQ